MVGSSCTAILTRTFTFAPFADTDGADHHAITLTVLAKPVIQVAHRGATNGFDPFQESGDRPERCGAVIEVIWPREAISPESGADGAALGENPRIES